MRFRVVAAAVVTSMALLATGCGLYRDNPYTLPSATPAAAGLLQNPGFESGADGWTANPSGALSVSSAASHSGNQSAILNGAADAVSVSQQLSSAQDVPEFVSGFVLLRSWRPAGDAEVGFRVTVRGGTYADGSSEHTIHFVIGGLDEAPLGLAANERYVFLRRGAPPTGAWTYFGYAVRSAFEHQFGPASQVEGVDVALELGGDGTQAWFDDVYAGTQVANTNRPPRQ